MFYLLNYRIWGTLQEWVYKTNNKDVHELRERSVDKWDKLNQHIIDKVIAEWKETLSLCGCRKTL